MASMEFFRNVWTGEFDNDLLPRPQGIESVDTLRLVFRFRVRGRFGGGRGAWVQGFGSRQVCEGVDLVKDEAGEGLCVGVDVQEGLHSFRPFDVFIRFDLIRANTVERQGASVR